MVKIKLELKHKHKMTLPCFKNFNGFLILRITANVRNIT